jgi:hypothetical protein
VKRYKYNHLPSGTINNKIRNKMIEKEKMSKTFTIDRRKEARTDFDSRLEFNIQKRKIKKKQLEKKIYNYDFKPKINKTRINIYNSTAPIIKPRIVKKPKQNNNQFAKKTQKKTRDFRKTNPNLGKDTHLKKINQSKEPEGNFSNFVSEKEKSYNEDLGEMIGANMDSIKYDYSVTNNNSFESIHQRLKGSEFGFPTSRDNRNQKEEEKNIRQPEIKFSGFSKSQTRLTKQNLKKSSTEAGKKSNQMVEVVNQSLNNLKDDQFHPNDSGIGSQKEFENGEFLEREDVSQNRDGLNLLVNKENGKFVSNLVDVQTIETESETFFKLSNADKVNSMKLNIKGHFSEK